MIGSSPAFNLSEVGKTNHYHSEEEKQLIRDTVRCANEALKCLEIEKSAILLRETVLKSDLERYRVALSPIKQLPCDIIYCIFEMHCQNELPANLPFRSKPPQITLSHVCLAWRRVMLDFPKFWSNIVITPCWNARFGKVVEIANAWLSRARDLPCSVEFKFADRSEYRTIWGQDWHQNIIKNFVSRHKFKRLGVTFADYHLRDLFQLSDEKLSYIEDLCLRDVNSDSNHQRKLDFHKLINLTSFSLLPNPFIPTPLRPHSARISKFSGVMWHQLRHIQLRINVPALFCLTVMEHSSATLETCSLIIFDDGSLVSHREPIHCSRLRDFIVDVCSSDAVKVLHPFLLSLRLPNLKSLTFGSREYPEMPIDPSTLLMMQNISSMRLEELVISDLASDIDIQVLLTYFPSLRRLELPTKIKFTVATMCELGAGSIGANLEDLKIKDTDIDIITLLQTVKTRSSNRKEDNIRRAKPAPFKSVVLYCDSPDGVHIEIYQLMEEIDRLGVHLEVHFPDISDEEEWDEYSDEYSEGMHSESDIDIETFGFYY